MFRFVIILVKFNTLQVVLATPLLLKKYFALTATNTTTTLTLFYVDLHVKRKITASGMIIFSILHFKGQKPFQLILILDAYVPVIN